LNRNRRPTAIAAPRRLHLEEYPLTPRLLALQRVGGIEAECRRFSLGECSVLLGRGPNGWHLSIAHPTRYPTWDEVVEARYRLVPAAEMAMVLPKLADYVNLHENCFHLWECAVPVEWGGVRIGLARPEDGMP
jgi:hypothetical protein